MKLDDALQKKKFIVTSEVQRPLENPEVLINNLKRIKSRVHGIAIPESEFIGVVDHTIMSE